MAMETRRIIAGPSREELFDALRLRHEGRKVAFTVTPTVEQVVQNNREGRSFKAGRLMFHAQVDEIGIEDGSGNNWCFRLYDPHKSLGMSHLQGYINTVRREGHVTPVTD